jgi:putative transposase
MSSLQQRKDIIEMIEEATHKGARLSEACETIGISERTIQRWKPKGCTEIAEDKRPIAQHRTPHNKLTPAEIEHVLTLCNQPEYAQLPPSQIVPKLADKGQYIASESSFYRILKSADQCHHRGHSKQAQTQRRPTTHIANTINQVWMWDISYLPSTTKGKFFYLYMVEDLYSRYGVNWEVHEYESGDCAADLLEKACWKEHLLPSQRPVLHQDNGSVMKSFTFRNKLKELGISTSYSRPRVSDDNAYVESFFRTLKYAPSWPRKGFATIDQARAWVETFMHWYNHEHQHSGIQFVTPAQRYKGEDKAILAKRTEVYAAAKEKHPERWSKDTRDWSPIESVTLNPETQARVNSKDAA